MGSRGFHNVLAWGGDEKSLKEAQRRHLKWFKRGPPVLDIGCGRGVFLELLRENGILCVGIDIDPLMIEACMRKGLEVVCEDPIQYLSKVENCYGGILCSHVIEHMPPVTGLRLLELCQKSLIEGGYLVIATPNPACWSVISHDFWLDTTHVRPYPRKLLEAAFCEAGLKVIPGTDDTVQGSMLRRGVMFVRRWILGSMVYKIALETNHELVVAAIK